MMQHTVVREFCSVESYSSRFCACGKRGTESRLIFIAELVPLLVARVVWGELL